MNESSVKLTAYFDDPFWGGVFEHTEGGALSACKGLFGAEPKDYEVLDYVLHHYHELKFSPAVKRNGSRPPTIRSGDSAR